MKHAPVSALLVLAMLAFGVGVYHAADFFKAARPHLQRPTQTTGPPLPGTVYVVQAGALYRFQHGKFTQITKDNGWMQPAADPDGNRLVAVSREANSSDLYLLDRNGAVVAQVTHNISPVVEQNHWAFYPRFSADGSQLFYDYDPKDPDNEYRVDLSIFASPSDPSSRKSVQWTHPNLYTGGDVSPIPLRDGGLIYTKFSIDEQSRVNSQVWLQSRPGSAGVALTDREADCLQPALSPDEHLLAMVCTNGQAQGGEISVAGLYPATTSSRAGGGAGARPAGRFAVVFAGRQDACLPGAGDARRRLPALDASRHPVDGAAATDHVQPGPRRHVVTALDLVTSRSSVEFENRPTV